MDRGWWDSRIIYPCWFAWTPIDGRNHRRRNALIQATLDFYREAGRRAGHPPHKLQVGVHSLGYVAESTQEAVDDFFPGYAHTMTEIGKERGWPKMTRASFDAQRGPQGALLVGNPDEVVEKIVRHSEALGGISRITFMMNPASLPHEKLMRATELIGKRVAPALREVRENEMEISPSP